MIIFKTNFGDISIELDQTHAPKTAEQFLKQVKAGFYNDTIFHRVIDGFMIQGGGFGVDMQPKADCDQLENEADTAQANMRGSVAMARTSDPHSASSQFFINLADNQFLDFKSKSEQEWGYCVFAHVVDGMDVVDKIAKVITTTKAGHQNVPEDDVIVSEAIVSSKSVLETQ